MAKETLSIPGFNKGMFVVWDMYTQAAFKVNVTLKDTVKTYVENSKQTREIEPALAHGSAWMQGDNLAITIDIPQSPKFEHPMYQNTIFTPKGKVAGYVVTICVEDQPGGDDDYNDLLVTLTAWHAKG